MINSYLILQNGQETGPYTLYELMDMSIGVTTMVLSPLANDWQEAGDLPEFQTYFSDKGLYLPTLSIMAGFWWRLLAYIIDYFLRLVIIALSEAVFGAVLPILGSTGLFNLDSDIAIEFMSGVVTIFLGLFYHSVCEASPMRGSVGKVVLKLSVVDVNGGRISFGKAISRNLGKIISGLILCLGYLNILWDNQKQGWHDQWAKTYVIRRS